MEVAQLMVFSCLCRLQAPNIAATRRFKLPRGLKTHTSLSAGLGDCQMHSPTHVNMAMDALQILQSTFLDRKKIVLVAATEREFSQNFDTALAAFDVKRACALSQYVRAAASALLPVFSYIPPARETGTQHCICLKWSLCFSNAPRLFLRKHCY